MSTKPVLRYTFLAHLPDSAPPRRVSGGAGSQSTRSQRAANAGLPGGGQSTRPRMAAKKGYRAAAKARDPGERPKQDCRAAPVIVRPDTAAAGSPDSRHCLRQKAGTSHCGRPEPGYRIRLQGPDAGIADTRIPGVQFLQTPHTDCPPPETGRKGQAKITPKVFWVDFGNILKKFTWNFVFSDKIHTFVPTTAYMAIFHHIHHHHHHFPKG